MVTKSHCFQNKQDILCLPNTFLCLIIFKIKHFFVIKKKKKSNTKRDLNTMENEDINTFKTNSLVLLDPVDKEKYGCSLFDLNLIADAFNFCCCTFYSTIKLRSNIE